MEHISKIPQFARSISKSAAVILLTVSILLTCAQPVSAGIYYITAYPSTTQANTGATFIVEYKTRLVKDAAATGLIQGAFTYPSDLVQLQNVTIGDYPEVTYSTATTGRITVSSPNKGSNNGYDGRFLILTATYKAIAGGTANFSATNGTANDVMIVNGTNHTINIGSVELIGCLPKYTGVYPNCIAPSTPVPVAPVVTTTPKSSAATTTTPRATSPTPTSAPVTGGSIAGGVQMAAKQYDQVDDQLTRCLTGSSSDTDYLERLWQQSRLTYGDLDKTQSCFTSRKSVVPSNLAPVAPTKVKELPVKDTIKVDKVEQSTKNNSKALKLSGKAAPNQTVVIYLFSEPLVLVAKTDQNGSWTYELEDPMEPGKHEAYVTVEGDNNAQAVRSAGLNFAIVAAPATALNPTGLSLDLEKTSTSKSFFSLYIAGVVAVILIALIISLRFIRRRHTQPTVGSNPPTGTVVSGSGLL